MLEKHLRKSCPLEVISWDNSWESMFEEGWCVKVRRMDMQEHLWECDFRKVMWENEGWRRWVVFKERETHDEQWGFKVIEWKNGWGRVLQRQESEEHYGEWDLEPIQWTYHEFGWQEVVIRRDFKAHLKDLAYEHSLLFVKGQKRINQENEELKKELINLRKDYDVEIKAMFL